MNLTSLTDEAAGPAPESRRPPPLPSHCRGEVSFRISSGDSRLKRTPVSTSRSGRLPFGVITLTPGIKSALRGGLKGSRRAAGRFVHGLGLGSGSAAPRRPPYRPPSTKHLPSASSRSASLRCGLRLQPGKATHQIPRSIPPSRGSRRYRPAASRIRLDPDLFAGGRGDAAMPRRAPAGVASSCPAH